MVLYAMRFTESISQKCTGFHVFQQASFLVIDSSQTLAFKKLSSLDFP